MDKATWEKFKQRFGRELDLGDLKEVTGGKSFDYEELLRNSIFWGHLSYVDPSLPKCDYYAQWDRMGIKFEVRNGKYIYTDKETGTKVDFFGAWALVLKRFAKQDDVARTTAIDRISEKLAEIRADGKWSRWGLKAGG